MTSATPDDARETWPCPIARIWPDTKVNGKCRGDTCPMWRWVPLLATDDRFISAVQREITLMANENPSVKKELLHKSAVAKVTADPRAYTLPTAPERGYCGLGGKP